MLVSVLALNFRFDFQKISPKITAPKKSSSFSTVNPSKTAFLQKTELHEMRLFCATDGNYLCFLFSLAFVNHEFRSHCVEPFFLYLYTSVVAANCKKNGDFLVDLVFCLRIIYAFSPFAANIVVFILRN